MVWNSQCDQSLRFTASELEVSRKYIWDETSKNQLLAFLDAKPGSSVLDVGCGTGFLIRQIAANIEWGNLVGLDMDLDLLATAREQSVGTSIQYVYGNAYSLPLEDNSFDLVAAEFLICNLEMPLLAIREMVRVVRSGGRVVCIDPPSAQRFFYSPFMPDEIQQVEHVVNGYIAEKSLEKGVDKSIGIRLPHLFLKAGLTSIRARGYLNVKLECQAESLVAVRTRAGHQLQMLERQERRLESVVRAGVISAEQAERYIDFWRKRRSAVLEDPSLALVIRLVICRLA